MASTASPSRGQKRPLSTSDKTDATQEKKKAVSIVLTGGPSGGKSSILALIRDRLRKRGMQVITVPEYATHFFANSDGFQVEWVATEKEKKLQDVFLRYQIMQENMFCEYAALNSKPSVLLLDRAVVDQKVFSSSEDVWESALSKNNVTMRQLLDRYDMVMHLGTCALRGEYEWGPGSNNPGRYHNPEEAAKLDKVCEEVYRDHKQLRMVPHAKTFQDKVDQVMRYLEDALGVDGLAGQRQRIPAQCTLDSIPQEVLEQGHAFVVTSTYLDASMEHSVQHRLPVPVSSWVSGLKGEATQPQKHPTSSSPWDQTFEERRAIPSESSLARRVISEAEYHNEVRLARHESVHKHALTFQTSSGQHYELFYFQGPQKPDLVLDFTVGAEIPAWIGGVADVEAKEHPPSQKKLRRYSTAEEAEARQRCVELGTAGA